MECEEEKFGRLNWKLSNWGDVLIVNTLRDRSSKNKKENICAKLVVDLISV